MIALPDNSSICAETIRQMESVRTGLPSIVTPAAPALADYPNKNQSSVKQNVGIGRGEKQCGADYPFDKLRAMSNVEWPVRVAGRSPARASGRTHDHRGLDNPRHFYEIPPQSCIRGACAVPTRRGVACYAPTDAQSADASLHCLFLAQAVL